MSKIKNIKRKKVNFSLHNLAVENDESYIANDIVVHNCRSLLIAILNDDIENKDSYYYEAPNKMDPWGTNVPKNAVRPAKGFGG